VNAICGTSVEQEVRDDKFESLCRELAPLNLNIINAENNQRNSIPFTITLSSLLGAAFFFTVLSRYARSLDIDKNIYINSNHAESLNIFIENIKTLKDSVLISGDEKDQKITDKFIQAEENTRNKFQPASVTSYKKIARESVPTLQQSIQSLIGIRNELLLLKYGKEIVQILLNGSFSKREPSTIQNNPFTMFSQIDASGDIRNKIFTLAGLGRFYTKKDS
jgi:hypothetical protein